MQWSLEQSRALSGIAASVQIRWNKTRQTRHSTREVPVKLAQTALPRGMGKPRLVAGFEKQIRANHMPRGCGLIVTLNGSITMLPCNAILMRKWGFDQHPARLELISAVLALNLISTEFLAEDWRPRSKAPRWPHRFDSFPKVYTRSDHFDRTPLGIWLTPETQLFFLALA